MSLKFKRAGIVVKPNDEVVGYLAARPEPLHSQIRPGEERVAVASEGEGRKVSLGTVPDFAYPGPGVRLSGVGPGSPAHRAGLREGDVLLVKAFNVETCKKMGTTTASVKHKVGIFTRSDEKVTEELTTLAKNRAAEMGGDSIVAQGEPVDGSMSFDIYKCGVND